jgi:hypothetical protein
VTEAFPLGRWIHQQRKALRAGELKERRKKLLDAPEAGMVWEPGNEAWENKLSALRSYHRAHGHLAPRQDAVWGENDTDGLVPVGQHTANLRRKGGLGKDPERATARAEQLAAIDPDWCCLWPLDWQRHYRVLTDLVDADGTLPQIQPGVLFRGRWPGPRRRRRRPGGVREAPRSLSWRGTSDVRGLAATRQLTEIVRRESHRHRGWRLSHSLPSRRLAQGPGGIVYGPSLGLSCRQVGREG